MEELGISECDTIIISVKDNKVIIRAIKKFLRRRNYWSKTSVEEVEKDSEEITWIAQKD